MMNNKITSIALDAGLLNYIDNETPRHYFVPGNADQSSVEEFARLLLKECSEFVDPITRIHMFKHFGVEEHTGWVCSKCGTDRTKAACPKGHAAALTGDCPMSGVAL